MAFILFIVSLAVGIVGYTSGGFVPELWLLIPFLGLCGVLARR